MPEARLLDVAQKTPPYGVWINTQTGERRYHDISGVFYTNKEEIDALQVELKAAFLLVEAQRLNAVTK